MYNRVRGQFDGVRGTLFYDHRSPETSSITVIIDASSLDTGSAHRDEHLRSDDFFDTARHPQARFQSSTVQRSGADLILRGPLTIKGITRQIELRMRASRARTSGCWAAPGTTTGSTRRAARPWETASR